MLLKYTYKYKKVFYEQLQNASCNTFKFINFIVYFYANGVKKFSTLAWVVY